MIRICLFVLLMSSATSAEVVKVAASNHVLVLKSDGTLTGWGRNGDNELGEATGARLRLTNWVAHPIPVPLPGPAVDIGVAQYTSYAVMQDGTVLAWGRNRDGELGNGASGPGSALPVRVSGLSGVVQVVGGGYTALALLKDGTVYAWGSRSTGMTGDGKMPAQWGVNPSPALVPVLVPGLPPIARISAGPDHVLALAADGRVFAWGSNFGGQLGNGTRGERPVATPAAVPGLTDVIAIAAGHGVSSVVRKDGTVWVWGRNDHGGLGDGQRTDSPSPQGGYAAVPQPVAGVTGAVAIVSGHAGRHTMVLKKDGTLRAWGNTDWGQIGAGVSGTFQPSPQIPAIKGVKAVFAGGNHSFAVRTDGSFWIWGSESSGEGILGRNVKLPTAFPLE